MNGSRLGVPNELAAVAIAALIVCACGESAPESTAAPAQHAAATPAALVTVSASSEPAGAVVTGGGRMLGRTPFVTQVPIERAGDVPPTFEFTFQLPGYNPMTVRATPTNNTISVDAALTPVRSEGAPGAASPPTEVATAEPTRARILSQIVRNYQPTDASARFVWAATGAETIRVQLLCDERAVEAARRAAQRFRRDATCSELECHMDWGGNADPRLYAERSAAGVQLIGYWNALAGDATRARVERWRRDLECSEVVDAAF